MENFSPEPYLNRFKKTNHRLGEGSSKIVFEAIDLDNGCSVAWNEVLTGHLDPNQKLQIEAEVGLLRSIQHPNIIDIVASWASPDKVVFVTEIVESGDLQRFYRSHRIRLRVIKKWCRQVLSALSYLHSRQPPIVHRDVKCENILYNAGDGTVKIGDLGLSAFAVTEGLATSDIVLGTPNYMAPEQYEGICDFTVDIYAFGMCVLEMVCGEIPYASCNAAQIYRRVSSGQLPESIWRIRSTNVQEFILYCLKPTEDGGRRPSAALILLHPFLCEMTSTSEDDDVDLVLPRLRRPPRTRLSSTLGSKQIDRTIFDAKSLISENEEGKEETNIDTVKNGDFNHEIDSGENPEEDVDEDEEEDEEELEDEDEETEEEDEEEGEVEHTNLWEYDEWSGKVYDKQISENGEQNKNEDVSGSRYLIETTEDEDAFFYLGNDDDESLMDNSEEGSELDVGWESGPLYTLDLDTIAAVGSQVSLNQPQTLFVENENENFHFRSDIVRSDSVSSSVGLSVHEDRPEITLTTSDPLSPASFFSPTDGKRDTLDTGRGIDSKITDSGFINERDSPTGLNISTDDIPGVRSLSAESPSILDQNSGEMKLSTFAEAQSPQIRIDDNGQMNNARSFSDSSRLTIDASSSPVLDMQQEQQLSQSNSDVKRMNPPLVSHLSTPKRTQKIKVHLELVLEQDTVVEGQTIVNRASITFDFDRVQSDASTTARELFSHLGSVQRISVDELIFVPFLTALLETHRFECRVSSSAAFEGARLVLSQSAPRLEE